MSNAQVGTCTQIHFLGDSIALSVSEALVLAEAKQIFAGLRKGPTASTINRFAVLMISVD